MVLVFYCFIVLLFYCFIVLLFKMHIELSKMGPLGASGGLWGRSRSQERKEANARPRNWCHFGAAWTILGAILGPTGI